MNTLAPGYLKTASNIKIRSYDVALALGNSGKHKGAEKRLQEAVTDCVRAFGKGNPRTLAVIESLALVYQNQRLPKAEFMLLKLIQTRKCVQGTDHRDTLSNIANLASTYINLHDLSAWEREMMSSLLDRIRDNTQISEKCMVLVASLRGEKLMALLLRLKRENVPVTGLVVEAAAKNQHNSRETMMLLFDQRGDEVHIAKEVLKAAAQNWIGEEMAKLLNLGGDKFKITEEVLRASAGNYLYSEGVMELLLDRRGAEVKITEGSTSGRSWE